MKEKKRKLNFSSIFTPTLCLTPVEDSAEVFQAKSVLRSVLFPQVWSWMWNLLKIPFQSELTHSGSLDSLG